MKNAIILMTALIPTTGHADLIKFAAALPGTRVHVLVSGRTFEPYSSMQRQLDLSKHFESFPNVIVKHSVNDNAPQNPEDMADGFWMWWKNEINENFPAVNNRWDYVVASEPYGQNVADSLDADFIPFDIERNLNKARGTDIRENMWSNWDNIIPETREKFMIKAVMFGQESVGKTTMSKLVSDKLEASFIPEYARPYLEAVGSEVTESKMKIIHAGQAALQKASYKKAESPALIMDTDLFSTVGYYPIMNCETSESLIRDAISLSADIYYVLPDNIPFEEDPLRYGGNVRESSMEYWIQILKDYRQNYVVVPGSTKDEKSSWIAEDILKRFEKSVLSIKEFKRD